MFVLGVFDYFNGGSPSYYNFQFTTTFDDVRATNDRLQCFQLRVLGWKQIEGLRLRNPNGGLNTKQNYPYWGIEGTCDTIKEKRDGLNIDTYAIVTKRIEDKLAYTFYEQPMVVGVKAHNSKFEKYKGGIFHEECVTKLPMINTR